MTLLRPDQGEIRAAGCYASYTADELKMGNAHIERTWSVRGGLLYPVSIIWKDGGAEWLAKPSPYAVAPDFALEEGSRTVVVGAGPAKHNPVSEEGLRVTVESVGDESGSRLVYELWVYPGASAITLQLHAERPDGQADEAEREQSSGAEDKAPDGREGVEGNVQFGEIGCVDFMELAPPHLKLRQIEFWDQTDRHNELVFEKEWLLHPNEGKMGLRGNVFVLENVLDDTGLVLIKHAPLPHVRPVRSELDLLVMPGSASYARRAGEPPFGRGHSRYPLAFTCGVQGHGTGESGGSGYTYAVIGYSGGASGMTAALHAYQRQWRRFVPQRDLRLLSNTWGDRSKDGAIQESFMLAEVEAGARLGVDVIQIDDGWQKGKTVNSVNPGGVWNGFWGTDEQFWEPHPERFPNGLQPIIAAAKEKGMQFGLWFAPDSSNDFANWRRDADKLAELFRQGVHYFKIDGVKAHSKAGERNLQRMFEAVMEQSEGKVVFDLDVTAEVRPGYWGLMHTGPLFVENRYSDFHRYWPHQTLRNVWKLARYVDPVRLRMEWLNNARNADLYADDPLAPAAYAPDYLFAVTMFANPLGWFEISRLPAAYFEQAAPLIACWKAHREKLQQGAVQPIGEQPDGVAWTGFASSSPDGAEHYLLLFRENNPNADWAGALPKRIGEAAYEAELLYGEGSLRVEGGRLFASIPEKKRFVFAKLRRAGAAT